MMSSVVFLERVGLIARHLESDSYFDVGAIDMHRSPVSDSINRLACPDDSDKTKQYGE